MIGGVSRLRALAVRAYPGPWRPDPRSYVQDANGQFVADVYGDEPGPTMEFIAAANPEVVSALCDVYEAAARRQALMDSDETTREVNEAFIQAGADLRAALARLEET